MKMKAPARGEPGLLGRLCSVDRRRLGRGTPLNAGRSQSFHVSSTARSQFHSCLTFTLPSRFSSTSNVARSPAPRQPALTWMRSNLRKPEVENRSRKVGLRTFGSVSLVTSEKVSTPVRDRAMGSNSSMRLPTATRNFGIITAIAPASGHEEAPAKRQAEPRLQGLGILCVEGTTPTPRSYYNADAASVSR